MHAFGRRKWPQNLPTGNTTQQGKRSQTSERRILMEKTRTIDRKALITEAVREKIVNQSHHNPDIKKPGAIDFFK